MHKPYVWLWAVRRAGKRAQLRAGYAGHLTIIANQLAAAAARRPAVHAVLKAHAAWQSYVVHELGPRNEARLTVPAVPSGCGLGNACMPLVMQRAAFLLWSL